MRKRVASLLLPIALSAFVAFVLLCIFATAPFRQREFNSDTLYLPVLYRDVVEQPYPLSGWFLTPAPYVFPDLPIYFLLRRATGDDGHAFTLYAVLFAAAFLGSVYFAACQLRISFPRTIALLIGGAVLLSMSLQEFHHLALAAFFPSYHGSVCLAAVLLVGVLGSAPHEPLAGKRLGWVVVLGALMTLADPSMLTQVLAPLAVASSSTRRHATGAASLRSAWGRDLTLLLLGPFLFAVVARFLLWLGMGIIVPGGLPVLDRGQQIITLRFWDGVVSSLGQIGKRHSTSVLLGITGFAMAGFWYVRNRGKTSARSAEVSDGAHHKWFLSTFVLLCFASTLIVPVLTTNFIDIAGLRYLLPCLLVAPLGLFLITDALDRVYGGWRILGLVGMTVGACFPVSSVSNRVRSQKLGYASTYPEAVACLDTLARAERLQRGVGDYWEAKFTTYYSHADIRVNQFRGDLRYRAWISNDAWLLERDSRPIAYDFVLVQHTGSADRVGLGTGQSLLAERFGSPRMRVDCKRFDVLVYDRPEDHALRNFMQVPSRQVLGLSLPGRIVEPAELSDQRYVWDLSPEKQARAHAFDGSLEVRFAEPQRGDILDIASPAVARFRVMFFDAGGMELGALEMPSMSRPGLMRVRLLALPANVRGTPIKSMRIDLLEGGADAAKLGHLFILTDTGSGT